jgi:autotransporter-associated beta strand protein
MKRVALLGAMLGMATWPVMAQTYTWIGADGGTWDNVTANWDDGTGAMAFPAGVTYTLGAGSVAIGDTTFNVAAPANLTVGETIVNSWGGLPAGTQITAISDSSITVDKAFTHAGSLSGVRFYFYQSGTAVFNSAGSVEVSGLQGLSRIDVNAAKTFNSGTIFVGSQLNVNAATTFNSAVWSAAGNVGTGTINLSADATVNGGFQAQYVTFSTANATLTLKGGSSLFNLNTQGTTSNNARTATVALDGGVYTNGGGVVINTGNIADGSGGLVVRSGTVVSTGFIHLGYNGAGVSGVLNLEGGVLDQRTSIIVGRGNFANSGRFVMSGGTLSYTASTVGILLGDNYSSGTIDITGGVANITDLGILTRNSGGGANAAAKAELNISGSAVVTIDKVNFGSALGYTSMISTTGTGILNLGGGVLNVGSGGIVNLSTTGNPVYNINLSGGTLGAKADFAVDASLPLTLSDADGGVAFNTNGKTITVNSALNGGGTFTKTGEGTLLLVAASNGYQGDAVIDAGVLSVNGTLDLGVLTFAISGDGSALGQVAGLGTLNLDALAFDLSGATGEQWDLSGAFAAGLTVDYVNGAAVFGWTDQGNGLWSDGVYQFDFNSNLLTVIPEPSAVVLLGLGALALAAGVIYRRQSVDR